MSAAMFIREKYYQQLLVRLNESRRFIQLLMGPRQVGKTTLIHQMINALHVPAYYTTGDESGSSPQTWLNQQWEIGRLRATQSPVGAVLVIDEIQKIPDWSNTVKTLWDQDSANSVALKVVILGSSALFLQQGLSESLAGRFEVIPMPHWSFAEMRDAFNFSLEQYVYFGGYPGAASLIGDKARWSNYVREALIETTISKDILQATSIRKPALLRQLFYLGCEYSGQILSYQKLLGQLQDAGNTTTLAGYLTLLSNVGILTGLSRYSGSTLQQRSSSPKFQVFNTAFLTAINNLDFKSAQEDKEYWGRLVENAIGAHLLNSGMGKNMHVFYWREKNKEVDFVLQSEQQVVAIEVKSGARARSLSGMQDFAAKYHPMHMLLIGGGGISIEEFLLSPIEKCFF